MGLSTIFLYKKDDPATTESNTVLQNAIDLATALIESYCDRNFESTRRQTVLNGYSGKYIAVPEYPVTSIYGVYPYLQDTVWLNVANSIFSLNYRVTGTQIVFETVAFDGTVTTYSYLFATYPQLSDLVAEMNLDISELTASVATNLSTQPSRLLFQDGGLIIGGQQEYLKSYYVDISNKYLIDTESNNLIISSNGFGFGVSNILVDYLAGYIYPVDNALHTALTVAGTVPRELIYVCNRLVAILIKEQDSDVTQYNLQSESLGDYSYANVNYDGKTPSAVDAFIQAFKPQLDHYKRKNLTW